MKKGMKMQFQQVSAEPWIEVRSHDGAHRLLDVVVAAVALAFFTPIMLLLAALVKLDSPGPALFRHERLGRDGKSFGCLKFRTMATDAAERLSALLESDPQARAEWAATHKLKNDPRITRLGSFLRKSSLDELPQLLNILRGEMALVGPRPIVAAEVAFYGDQFRVFSSVRPGITGLWQISGRNDTSYAERVALDVSYVRQRSVMLDIRILIGTIPAVLLRRGSY